MSTARLLIAALLLVFLAGCGDLLDDLNPTGVDKTSSIEQTAPDFNVYDIDNNPINLYAELDNPNIDAVVLYFTMWCSICDAEMSHMQSDIIPDFSNVRFFAVDYHATTIAEANANEGNGWPLFTTLADIDNTIENLFNGGMATTVVIDSSRIVRMNETYKYGQRLRPVLEGLTP